MLREVRREGRLMGRPIRAELANAEREARRYVQSQVAEARKLGYPRMSAFAKDIARGTVCLAPTPEDDILDRVGRFLWRCTEVERRIVTSAYGESYTGHVKARRLGISFSRFNRVKESVLLRLSGYLVES